MAATAPEPKSTGPREYWMVQYRRSADDRMQFKYCESRIEADRVVAQFKREGLHATAWEL